MEVAKQHVKNVQAAKKGNEHVSKEKRTTELEEADKAAGQFYEETHRKIEALPNVIKHLCLIRAHCDSKDCSINGML